MATLPLTMGMHQPKAVVEYISLLHGRGAIESTRAFDDMIAGSCITVARQVVRYSLYAHTHAGHCGEVSRASRSERPLKVGDMQPLLRLASPRSNAQA